MSFSEVEEAEEELENDGCRLARPKALAPTVAISVGAVTASALGGFGAADARLVLVGLVTKMGSRLANCQSHVST